MDMGTELKTSIYDYVQQGLLRGKKTEDELCEEFAAKSNLTSNQCKNVYLDTAVEYGQLREKFEDLLKVGIERSKSKQQELLTATSPKERTFEPWEDELITLAMQVRQMPRATLAKYLADIMPHRTWRAYNAHIMREGNKMKAQSSTNALSDVVVATVTKLTDRGAIMVTPDGRRGMLHINEIADEYVDNIHDYLHLGQTIKVKTITDNEGRLAFSTKQIGGLHKTTTPNIGDVSQTIKANVVSLVSSHTNPAELLMTLDALIVQFEEGLTVLKSFRASVSDQLTKLDQLQKLRSQLNDLL